MALELINKQDNSEIVRDQIAAILAVEVANQKALATAAGEDPALWDLEVYSERSDAWEKWRDSQTDKTPIVNVWFESATFDRSGSNISERQKTEGTFNVDCMAVGVSGDSGDGHTNGDKEAALAAQRAARLIRNILMAAENTYLGMQGVVWGRWPDRITAFQMDRDPVSLKVVGVRVSFRVAYNEFSPQVPAATLELVSAQVERTEDGAIVVAADYDYTGG